MKFRDYFFFLFISAAIGGSTFMGWNYYSSGGFSSRGVNREDAKRETTTLVRSDEWIEFLIPLTTKNVRLMTNAAVQTLEAPLPTQSDPRPGWRYAVDVQVCADDGSLIDERVYHFRSRARQLRDAETGETIHPLFFGENAMIATETRVMQMSIDQFDKAASIIRVRLHAKDQAIDEVVARVDSRVEREDYDSRRTWNRMSGDAKNSVCNYCVYNHHLLTIPERNNLMRWQWLASPTIGVFDSRFLYFVGDSEDREINEKLLPAGLAVQPGCLASIPVPEEQGQLELSFIRLEPEENSQWVNLKWTGKRQIAPFQERHALESESSSVTLDVQGGLIELESALPFVVRAFWSVQDQADKVEITPLPSNTRYFLANDRPLEFEISHLGEEATPIRISTRFAYRGLYSEVDAKTSEASNQVKEIEWFVLDQNENVLNQGTIVCQPAVSSYDQLGINGQLEPVSDAENWYFVLPVEAKKVRFSSTHNVLMSAAVRPPDLRRSVKVPEGYQSFTKYNTEYRNWFALKPISHLDLIRENRSFLIRTQQRPVQRDEEILAGKYEWFRYLPNGEWIGRQMLVPRESDFPVREQAINSTFFELELDKSYPFTEHKSRAIFASPRIFYASNGETGQLKLLLDNECVLTKNIVSARGEIELSQIDFSNGSRLEVQTNLKARVFVAGLDVAIDSRFLKQTAQRLDQGALEFEYEKKTRLPELVTLQIFRESTDKGRCRVNATIEGTTKPVEEMGPFVNWSINNYSFDIAEVETADSILIGSEKQVTNGSRCFLKLGEDLPPGKYKIRIERVDSGLGGYVLLYQTVAGSATPRTLKIQQVKAEGTL